MSNRLSQEPVEVLVQSSTLINFRLSQLPIEILILPAPTSAIISQEAIEILVVPILAVEDVQFLVIG